MSKVNLRDYYPYYSEDFFIEIPDELVEDMKPYLTEDQNHWRRMRRHKVDSLDRKEFSGHAFFTAPSSYELCERNMKCEELYAAMSQLQGKQMERLIAHFVLGISIRGIARVEGVHHSSVEESIWRGLSTLKNILNIIL